MMASGGRGCVALLGPKESREQLLLQFLGQKSLPKSSSSVNDVPLYDLHLATKYYSVDVWLCQLDKQTAVSAELAEVVDAVVLTSSDCDVVSIQSWDAFVKILDPSCKVLLCARLSKDSAEMEDWCVSRGFELVESEPNEETSAEAEECGELVGFPRLLQILQTHSWPNLEMKDEPMRMNSERLRQLFLTDESNEGKGETSQSSGMEESESFEQLFSKLSDMKEAAAQLPPEERRAHAEKVVVAFWKAIGGDGSELAGIDSSDDD